MTLDKIKIYMDETIYKFWTEDLRKQDLATQEKVLKKAYKRLKTELDNGILKGIKYHAELQLIEHLSGNTLK